MEREEFRTLVKGMKAVYPQPTFIPDKDAFDVWYGLLKDLPYEVASVAIQKHMLTEKFPPTIADIRSKAGEITAPQHEEMGELEAWALVYKAICNSGYHAEEEFAKLPEACQIAVGKPANLKEWGMMDISQVSSVQQSHFVRNYRAAVQRMKEEAKIPESVRRRISEIKEQAIGIPERKQPLLEQESAEKQKKAVPMPKELSDRLHEILGR